MTLKELVAGTLIVTSALGTVSCSSDDSADNRPGIWRREKKQSFYGKYHLLAGENRTYSRNGKLIDVDKDIDFRERGRISNIYFEITEDSWTRLRNSRTLVDGKPVSLGMDPIERKKLSPIEERENFKRWSMGSTGRVYLSIKKNEDGTFSMEEEATNKHGHRWNYVWTVEKK